MVITAYLLNTPCGGKSNSEQKPEHRQHNKPKTRPDMTENGGK